MKRIAFVLSLLIMAVVAAAQKPAVIVSNEPGWHKIGEITASFKTQEESIVVWGADKFSQLKLRVTDAPIHIQKMQVVYESGDVEDIDVTTEIEPWGETRTIDLKNPNGELKKVSFTYQTMPNYRGDKAQVELYGFKEGNNSDSYRSDRSNNNDVDSTSDRMKTAADTTMQDVEDGVDKVGNKISEMAGNAAAEVNDQFYSGKMGPNGENIYIDKHSKYYYIDGHGKKVYIDKTQLRDKPKKD